MAVAQTLGLAPSHHVLILKATRKSTATANRLSECSFFALPASQIYSHHYSSRLHTGTEYSITTALTMYTSNEDDFRFWEPETDRRVRLPTPITILIQLIRASSSVPFSRGRAWVLN